MTGKIRTTNATVRSVAKPYEPTPGEICVCTVFVDNRLAVERQRDSDWDNIGERQAGEWSSVRVKEPK